MEVSVEETVLPDTTTITESALLPDTIPVVTVGSMPILTDAIATTLSGATPTILNVPIFSAAAGSGYVIATGPDGTGPTVFLDTSQVALLTHGAARAATIFDGNLLQFSTADAVTVSQETTNIQEETVVAEPLLLTHETASQQNAVQHMNTDDEIRPPIRKGPYRCDLCDREFIKWNQFQRHLKQHADDKPHRCDQCDLSFNVKSNLLLHQATHCTTNPECPECGKKFSRVASLKAHIMLHEKEENLMCPECGEEFSTQPYLDKHMQEHCEEILEEKVYPCKLCPQTFTKAAFLREHMKIHYKLKASLSHRVYKRNINRTTFPHKCSNCGKAFQKPSQLVRHNRIHTGERPFKCEICSKAFNQKGALQIHMTKHSGERPHPCDFCPAAFAQRGNLRAHIKRVHTLTKEGNEVMFQCEECACVFKKLGSLTAHISRMHTGEPLREGEDNDDAVESGNNPEAKSMKKVIQQLLELSKQTTVTPEQAQQQIQEIAENSNVSADILQQALENSGLASTTPSNENKQDEGKEKTDKTGPVIAGSIIPVVTNGGALSYTLRRSIVRKVGGVRWRQCMYCSKEFKKPSDLVRHIRIHTHEKPYKCTQCYRAFAVKSTLTVHLRTHTGIKEFRCEICKKMFSTQGSLKVHLRLHTGAKPFSCNHCDKKFRTSGHKKSHMVSHMRDGVQPKRTKRVQKPPVKETVSLLEIPMQEPILITDAGLVQQAPKRNGLYQEYIDDARSSDRPYKCTHCSRGFKKSSHLKQHIRSHTGEKPYKCLQCCRSFVSNGVLKAHIRTHSGVKAYKCTMCDATFTTNGSRKRHMCTHSELRPYMCPYCQKTFKTSMTCKKHMKTHRHELVSQGATSGVTVTVVPETGSETQVDMVNTNAQDLTGHIIGNLTEITDEAEERETEEPVQITSLQTQDSAALTTQSFATQVTLSQENLQQLQQSLNQQVFETQPNLTADLEQATINSSQANGFDQSQTTFFAQSFNSFPQNQYTLQGDVLDVPNNFTSAPTLITDSLAATSMASILPQQQQGITQDSTQNSNLLSLQSATENRIVRPLGEIHQIENRERRRTYQCTICDKIFKKSSHLKQHHRTHTGEKPFKCPQCGRMFVSMGVLRAHLKTHTGAKDYQCSVCQAFFTTNGSLTRHMAIHSCTHPHHCSYCSQTFRTPTSYRRHLKTHHDDNQNFETDDSNKPRKGKTNLVKLSDEQAKEIAQQNPDETTSISVKVLIASAAEKNRISEIKDKKAELEKLPKYANQCDRCPKSFKKPSDLVRHIRIHTGEKPYMCEMCGKSFTVKSTLDSHVKTHTGEKSFTCHVCNSQFSTKGSLKVHMRLHTGSKPFKCPHCELRFRTSGHRKSHIISHLKEKNSIGGASSVQESDNMMGLPSDSLNTTGSTETAPSQMVEGIQLQLASNVLAQSIQITGIDPSLLSQTVQIDANLLQQLQQHGNINITITPNPLMESLSTTADAGVSDSSVLQGSLSNEGTITTAVNPNIIIHSLGNINVPLSSDQEIISTNNTSENRNQEIPKIAYNILAPNDKNTHIDTVEEERQKDINEESVLNVEGEIEKGDDLPLENDTMPVESIPSEESEILQNMEFVPSVSEDVTVTTDAVRAHVCSICKKGFKRASHLKEHMFTHQPLVAKQQSRPTPYLCSHCGKSFAKPSQLERHNRIHTGERPFVCSLCKKAFNQKNALQIHMKKHTGERPFACPHCNMAFTQNGNLKMHIARAHSDPDV